LSLDVFFEEIIKGIRSKIMPFYPSNIYPNAAGVGTNRAGNLTTNNPGSNFMNNLTTYQELKDTVVGPGYVYAGSTLYTPNDVTSVVFNSAAKYPTDVRYGTSIGVTTAGGTAIPLTDPLNDLTSAVTTFVAAGFAYTTAIAGMGASTKMIAASFAGLTLNNLVRKIQYVNWELGRVGADLTLVKAGTGFTFAVGRYPSSLNRFTNTAGGI
jgi:hypothetical protein